MRSGFYRRRDGTEGVWFSPQDIESMVDAELQKAGLYPTLQSPRVDVERFIARHLNVDLDQHADLERHILGHTEFFTSAPPRISINRDLTNAIDDDDSSPGLLGRWRATLAHEASHVLMHKVLFEVADGQDNLFQLETSSARKLMRCLKRNVLFRAGGSDPREVQANMGMAALLMPERFLRTLVVDIVREHGLDESTLVGGSTAASDLATVIRDRCGVSRQAAAIRLETIGAVSARGQVRFRTDR